MRHQALVWVCHVSQRERRQRPWHAGPQKLLRESCRIPRGAHPHILALHQTHLPEPLRPPPRHAGERRHWRRRRHRASDDVRVFHTHPSRQHSAVRAPEGNDGRVRGAAGGAVGPVMARHGMVWRHVRPAQGHSRSVWVAGCRKKAIEEKDQRHLASTSIACNAQKHAFVALCRYR